MPAEYRRGLLVTDLKATGPSFGPPPLFDAGHDIIVRSMSPRRMEIHTSADLEELLKSVKKDDYLSLLVYNTDPRGQGTRVVNVQVP